MDFEAYLAYLPYEALPRLASLHEFCDKQKNKHNKTERISDHQFKYENGFS